MKGKDYRASLERAVRYYRNGRTFDQIKGVLGGCAQMWHLLLELKGEAPPEGLGLGTLQEAVALKESGMTQRQIAERMNVSEAELSRHLKGVRGQRVQSWEDGRICAREALADYKNGVDLRVIAAKYGYRSSRVALAAISRIEKRIEWGDW